MTPPTWPELIQQAPHLERLAHRISTTPQPDREPFYGWRWQAYERCCNETCAEAGLSPEATDAAALHLLGIFQAVAIGQVTEAAS